jgi:hypothetical protein
MAMASELRLAWLPKSLVTEPAQDGPEDDIAVLAFHWRDHRSETDGQPVSEQSQPAPA